MTIAYILDLVFGDPKWLYHPVRVIGSYINWFQKKFYMDSKKRGLLLLVSSLVIIVGTLFILREVSIYFGGYYIFMVYFLYTSLATNSLIKEVMYVTRGNSINEQRKRLSFIVSRNTEQLKEHDINRSLVETVSENTIDGILSPLFYIFLGFLIGYPVLVVYFFKVVSTLDSMVGYKNEKYHNYGYFSAKADDVLNYIPARIGSLFLWIAGLITGKHVLKGMKSYIRYRGAHDSPNAGHSESMVAGLLNVRLGGPNIYHGVLKEKPYIGDGVVEVTKKDVHSACFISLVSSILMFGVIVWILGYMVQIPNVL